MKLNTVMPYQQTATLVSFTTSTASDGSLVRDYYDNGEIAVRFVTQSHNNATVYTDVELPLFTVLREIRDRGGDLMFANDQLYMIKYVTPVINILGYQDGYSYTAFLQES
jgi:hypothetical protein